MPFYTKSKKVDSFYLSLFRLFGRQLSVKKGGNPNLRASQLTAVKKWREILSNPEVNLQALHVYIKIKMDEKEVKLKSSTLKYSNLAMVLARPWVGVRVCHLLLLFFHDIQARFKPGDLHFLGRRGVNSPIRYWLLPRQGLGEDVLQFVNGE